MIFSTNPIDAILVSRSDVYNPLATFSRHSFELDGYVWPSAEHYYQAMKFIDTELQETIRNASHPMEAKKLAKKNKRSIRSDWKKIKKTIMTRAVYIKCRANPDASQALLATENEPIVENSQYDYFWGCGRDYRGENNYGKILMEVRAKLREIA